MTTAEELREQMAIEAGEERRRIEASLAEYHRLNSALNGTFVCPDCGSVHDKMKQRVEKLKEEYRAWMKENGCDEIVDPETRVRVYLQSGGTEPVFDLTRLDPGALVRLAQIPGLLTANDTALKALGDTSADLAALRDVRDEVGKTPSLRVEKKDR